jgi:hypothetical protein
MIKEVLTFKPKKAVKDLLINVPDRARQIIKMRYGLEDKSRMTLEAIGKIYNITRERVRQVEDFTIKMIKKSPAMTGMTDVFTELESAMEEYGGIVHEADFLEYLAPKDQVIKNNIHFLLVLGDAFSKLKEDDSFYHRWTVDKDLAQAIHDSIKNLSGKLSENDLLTEQEIVDIFIKNVVEGVKKEHAEKHARKWLNLSKDVGQSPIGEWGLTSSPNVRVRGIRDYAYLIMRKHGSPMHFTEVAKAIEATFKRTANSATCHNELIKDDRFVLVGRGIYALTEWGYQKGIVRDVIRELLKKNGPMSKDEILEKVLKERYVKENTILVNLKNPKFFKENKDNKFSPVL